MTDVSAVELENNSTDGLVFPWTNVPRIINLYVLAGLPPETPKILDEECDKFARPATVPFATETLPDEPLNALNVY
jgi:hypothetical protein